MSIRRDLVIKVSNGSATLDMPLQIYEKDHGIELRFKLMDYKYKYDKDPENILNSNKEDILEAYTTIINPIGYELAQINGEVIDDTVRFMIEDSYTDELEELGIYQLQIHVKCKHSEFSIPPVRFEVLERLKGEKVVTDGDDEVDYSDIIDGSTKFIDDETGKLIIKWQKGDTISSVKLNAMVEVINNAVDEEVQRQLNEVKREQQELERENKLDESMIEYETRFNALTASQQQDMEVIDARDGEVSLKARLDRDVKNPLQVYEDVEGSYISCDSTVGYAQNVEILGNTIQDADNLADIRSVGGKVEGQELYKIDVVSCGENLFDKDNVNKLSNTLLGAKTEGDNVTGEISRDDFESTYWIKIKPSTTYTIKRMSSYRSRCGFTKDEPALGVKSRAVTGFISTSPLTVTSMSDEKYLLISGYCDQNYDGNITEEELLSSIQINVGTTLKPYTAYQSDKLSILSPVQLEKVGDVADRIVCKDGVWGVEKNVKTVIFNGSETWYKSSLDHSSKDIMRFFTSSDAVATSNVIAGPIMSDKFTAVSYDGMFTNNIEGISTTYDMNIGIGILKSRLSTQDIAGFVAWVQANPILVKYQTATSTFIPLPHDQQIKLRTFAGQTNIHFETEIEGTIKASVPKSLGATINSHSEQIDNLNKELGKVKKLEESTVSTVTTESYFTTVKETANGYFEDVKLEGRTLVNLINYSKTLDANVWNHFVKTSDLNYMLTPNTEYTLIVYVQGLSKDKSFYIQSDNSHGIFNKASIQISSNGIWVLKATTKADFTNITDVAFIAHNPDDKVGMYTISLCILEGDHTQNPPSYFEGLKSIGEDVEEISVESVTRRLFDLNTVNQDWLTGTFDTEISSDNLHYHSCEAFDVSSLRNKQIYIRVFRDGVFLDKAYPIYVCVFDENKIQIEPRYSADNMVYLVPSNAKYMRIMAYIRDKKSLAYIDRDEYYVRLTPFKDNEQLIPHQSNKKPLLYYNPTTDAWEKPILREWDSIEKHSDGKYYYHKRSGEVVLNGSEEWTKTNTYVEAGFSRFYSVSIPNKKADAYLICDKLPTSYNEYMYGDLFECIGGISRNDRMNIKFKGDLSVDDCRVRLSQNPITVVYQLEQEQVYECINIDLLTYENETNFIVNTGAISPKSTLKVICNITNVVRELQQKVSNLENYIQHVMIDALNNALNE